MLSVYVDGTTLRSFGSYGVTSLTTTARGSGDLSWQMDPNRSRPLAWAINKPVVAKVDGSTIWGGHLVEAGPDGTFFAKGLPELADSTPALDAAGEPTNGDLTAMTEAITRGALDGWRAVDVFPAWAGEPEPGRTIAQLLDLMGEANGLRWAVDPKGTPYAYAADPGVPDWHIRVPGYRYGYDATDLVTHLFGHYMSGVGTYAYTSVETGVLAMRREEWVDLREDGIISEATAQTRLMQFAAAQGLATPAPTEKVVVNSLNLRTPGGVAQPPWRVKGGDTVRLWGATDGRSGKDYLDVRVESTDYDPASETAVLEFAHAKPRGYMAVQEEALSA